MPTKTIPLAKEDCKRTNKRPLLEIVGILSKRRPLRWKKESKEQEVSPIKEIKIGTYNPKPLKVSLNSILNANI